MKSSKEVDWDIAPEGTTHYNEERFYPWLKETPPSYYVDGRGWIKYTSESYKDHFVVAVKRPQEMENNDWDGSGVPPVGTVCEYSLNDGEWFKCKIVYVLSGTDDFVAWCDHLHMEQFLTFTSERYKLQLRKIKTSEQIAEEERLQAVDEMLSLVGSYGAFKDVMGDLYDAGYRKQVEK